MPREIWGRRAVACANLPYYITTPAITVLLESGAFEQVTVMVQKEVAQRICAAPGTAAYSAFTIYVQYHAAAEILFDVPADCFVPRPKVDSAVLRLRPLAEPAVKTQDEKLFFALVRAAFNMRRKTLVNALGPVLGSSMGKEEIIELVLSGRPGRACARRAAQPPGLCAAGGCSGGTADGGVKAWRAAGVCPLCVRAAGGRRRDHLQAHVRRIRPVV